MTKTSWRNRAVVGSALGAAAIAVIVDHTRHPLPKPEPAVVIVDLPAAALADNGEAVVVVPCGLEARAAAAAGPCSLGGGSPCALDASPCSL